MWRHSSSSIWLVEWRIPPPPPLWTFKVVLKWRAYGSVNFCDRKNSKPTLKRTQKTGFNELYFIEICNYHVTCKKIRPKWTRPNKGKESEARLERSFSQFVTVEYNQIVTTKVELRYKWHLWANLWFLSNWKDLVYHWNIRQL